MEYKSIKEIVSRLSADIERLENGSLNVEDLEVVLNDVRSLHERIAILQYLAVQPLPTDKVKTKPTSFSFGVDQSMLDSLREPSNQTNLLDAIEQTEEPKLEVVEQVPESNLIKEKEEVKEVIVEEKEEIIEDKKEDKLEKSEGKSINETFSTQQEQESLAQKLSRKPISDLTVAIGLNQKFLFMNDLFEGENNLYKEAINALNNFKSYFEADEYIHVLSSRHNWDSTSKSVKDLIELVERRYS